VGLAGSPERGPVEGLTLHVAWRPNDGRLREEWAWTGPGGVFALCSLPFALPLTVRLQDGEQLLAEHQVQLSRGEFRWLELRP
jgi:hypothetical protein